MAYRHVLTCSSLLISREPLTAMQQLKSFWELEGLGILPKHLSAVYESLGIPPKCLSV